MTETAGSVTIQITANTAAFEAALARAKEQATAFDAAVSAKLSGAGVSEGLAKIAAGVEQTNALLAKLTTSGTSAGVALAKVAASTKETTAALSQVATATKLVNAEMASIGGSAGGAAALGAGTIAAKDFAAALELTGGNLSKITPQMVGLAAANEEVAVSSKAAAVGMAGLGAAETEAAGLGAGVTREFSVLGAEVARGNFSRIPGSLIVMNQRLAATGAGVLTLTNFTKAFGALGSVIFNPFVLGFLALSIGTEVALRGFGALKGGVDEATSALEAHKKTIDAISAAYPEAAAAAKKFADQAKDIPKSVAAVDLSHDIVTNVTAMNDALKGIEQTLASPLLAGGRTNFDGIGLHAATEFGQLGQELKNGTIDAIQYQIALSKIQLDPNETIKARAFADTLTASAAKLVESENAIKASGGIKSISVDSQKATQTLFDVSAGFKDVKTNAGSADATIAKLFGTLNAGGSGFGVTRSIADQFGSQFSSQIQATAGMFQTVDQAVQQVRQDQLASMVQLQSQFHATTTEVDVLKQALATAGGKDNIRDFFGDVTNIKNANAEIENSVATVQKLFAAMATGNTSVNAVSQGLEMVRQTLINDGFPTIKVDAFLNRLEEANRQLVADQGQVHQLGAALNALHDRTINIVVRTTQVGSGLQSTYDVPGGPVSVTRYGGQSDMTQQSYQVPATGGYDSSIGTSGVTVTRFGGTRAAGGPLSANMPYWVGEHGPELVVPQGAGSVIPNSQSMALASAQSAFTGTQPTKEGDRVWTVLMNVEANTRKTAQLLDEIKTTSLASSSGLSSGSSYGGSSSTSSAQTDPLAAEYMSVLATWKSNFAAIGGGGIIGYGSSGLGATPEQIARNLVYGGMSPIGSPSGGGSIGGGGYQTLPGGQQYPELAGLTPSSPGYAQAYNSALARVNKAAGFNTGGMIAPGDSQEVRFFKSPEETVGIFTPAQMKAMQGGSDASKSGATADNRPIQFSQVNHWNGNAPPSKDSLAAVRRATALGFMDAQRSARGR